MRAAELVMRTAAEVGPVIARGPHRQAAATAEAGQATHPKARILISMTRKAAGAVVGTARRAEAAVAGAQVVDRAGGNIPTKSRQAGTLQTVVFADCARYNRLREIRTLKAHAVKTGTVD